MDGNGARLGAVGEEANGKWQMKASYVGSGCGTVGRGGVLLQSVVRARASGGLAGSGLPQSDACAARRGSGGGDLADETCGAAMVLGVVRLVAARGLGRS